jgi:hypothetical protein
MAKSFFFVAATNALTPAAWELSGKDPLNSPFPLSHTRKRVGLVAKCV